MHPEVYIDILHVSEKHLQPASVSLNRISRRGQIGVGDILSVNDHIVGALPGFNLIRSKIIRCRNAIQVNA